MRSCLTVLLTGVFVFAVADRVIADELEDVEKALEKAWNEHKTYTADVDLLTVVDQGGQKTESKGSGKIEGARREGKRLSRMELKVEMMGMEQDITTITDGKYTYSLMSFMGNTMAQKMDADPKSAGTPSEMFASLKEEFDVKLLPEAEVDGNPVYVIEATRKEEAGPNEAQKLVFSFRKDCGVMVQMQATMQGGQSSQTLNLKNVKTDVDIKPERFEFKAPEGVTIVDQSTKDKK